MFEKLNNSDVSPLQGYISKNEYIPEETLGAKAMRIINAQKDKFKDMQNNFGQMWQTNDLPNNKETYKGFENNFNGSFESTPLFDSTENYGILNNSVPEMPSKNFIKLLLDNMDNFIYARD